MGECWRSLATSSLLGGVAGSKVTPHSTYDQSGISEETRIPRAERERERERGEVR